MNRRNFFRSLFAIAGLSLVDPKKLLQSRHSTARYIWSVDLAYGQDQFVYAWIYAIHPSAFPKDLIIFKRKT